MKDLPVEVWDKVYENINTSQVFRSLIRLRRMEFTHYTSKELLLKENYEAEFKTFCWKCHDKNFC